MHILLIIEAIIKTIRLIGGRLLFLRTINHNRATKLIWDYYSAIYGKLEPGPRGVKIGEDISEELFNKEAYGFILEINFINDRANYIYMVNMEP